MLSIANVQEYFFHIVVFRTDKELRGWKISEAIFLKEKH